MTVYTRIIAGFTRAEERLSTTETKDWLTVGADRRLIALRRLPGRGPEIVWLGGFRSDMTATKATRLAEWAAAEGLAMTRFDYSGHGASEGDFADGTIGRWFEDAMAVIERIEGPPLLVGSSMGGWIALLAARRLIESGRRAHALLLIAPAPDFTERLMWAAFPDSIRHEIETTGRWSRPSAYGEPVPITRALIEDGRRHLVLDGPIETGAPVHVLQGIADPDVPWRHALALTERLASDPVTLTLIRDGDHRLSRESDLDLICASVARLAAAPS